jgi:transposase
MNGQESRQGDPEMRAYSTDFRWKVIQAYETGRGSQRALAQLLGVSLSFVQELLQRYRQTGNVEPQPQGGGNPGKGLGHLAAIERFHAQQPDASLAERCAKLAEAAQVHVSRMTRSRALERLQLTRKKPLSRRRASYAGRAASPSGVPAEPAAP